MARCPLFSTQNATTSYWMHADQNWCTLANALLRQRIHEDIRHTLLATTLFQFLHSAWKNEVHTKKSPEGQGGKNKRMAKTKSIRYSNVLFGEAFRYPSLDRWIVDMKDYAN